MLAILFGLLASLASGGVALVARETPPGDLGRAVIVFGVPACMAVGGIGAARFTGPCAGLLGWAAMLLGVFFGALVIGIATGVDAASGWGPIITVATFVVLATPATIAYVVTRAMWKPRAQPPPVTPDVKPEAGEDT
jgi:hypothetical protein